MHLVQSHKIDGGGVREKIYPTNSMTAHSTTILLQSKRFHIPTIVPSEWMFQKRWNTELPNPISELKKANKQFCRKYQRIHGHPKTNKVVLCTVVWFYSICFEMSKFSPDNSDLKRSFYVHFCCKRPPELYKICSINFHKRKWPPPFFRQASLNCLYMWR